MLIQEIRTSINRASRENESDTPDYILAQFMVSCLEAYERAVTERDIKANVDAAVSSDGDPAGLPQQ